MLLLRDIDRRRLVERAEAEHPHEACGLLLGRRLGRTLGGKRSEGGSDSERRLVEELTLASNVEAERPGSRFVLAPGDFLAADSRARAAGLEILGAWHSHPDGPAEPSAEDAASAWPGWTSLIAGLCEGRVVELRAFRLVAGELVDEALVVAPPARGERRSRGSRDERGEKEGVGSCH